MQSNDNYLEEFRTTNPSVERPKRRLGFYSSKAVDAFISENKVQQENLQQLYQEKLEAQRMSLLAASRDRDDARKQVIELESQLKDTSDWKKSFSETGLVALEEKQVAVLREKAAEFDDLEKDNEKLQGMLTKQNQELTEADNRIRSLETEVRKLNDRTVQLSSELTEKIEARDHRIRNLERDLQQVIERYRNAGSSHAENLISLAEKYKEYQSSVDQLSRSILERYK